MTKKFDGTWNNSIQRSRTVTERPSRAPDECDFDAIGHMGLRSSLANGEIGADSVAPTLRGQRA